MPVVSEPAAKCAFDAVDGGGGKKKKKNELINKQIKKQEN